MAFVTFAVIVEPPDMATSVGLSQEVAEVVLYWSL